MKILAKIGWMTLALLASGAASAQVVDLPYGSKPFQTFDWFPPKADTADGDGRWVMFVHGNGGKKSDIALGAFGQQLQLWLRNGFTVFSIEWTPATAEIYPAQLDDIVRATQYIRANAASFDIAPNRMVMWGNSSGSTIAGWTTYGKDWKKTSGSKQDKQSTRPELFVNWGGLTNFLIMAPTFTGIGFGAPTLADLPVPFLESVSMSILVDDIARAYTPPVASYYGNVEGPAPYTNPHDVALMKDLHAHLANSEPAVASQSMMLANPVHPHTNILDIEDLTVWTLDRLGKPLSSSHLDLGREKAGPAGFPRLDAGGSLAPGSVFEIDMESGTASATLAFLFLGTVRKDTSFAGGTLVPKADLILSIPIDSTGKRKLTGVVPASVPAGSVLYLQFWHPTGAGQTMAASNALRLRFGQS